MFKKILFLFFMLACALEANNFRDGAIAFKKGDFQSAKIFLEKAIADEKSTHAAYYLGRMYLDGLGVKVDYDKASILLLEAFDYGNIPAGCYLSETYMRSGAKPSYIADGIVIGLKKNLPYCKEVFRRYQNYAPQF